MANISTAWGIITVSHNLMKNYWPEIKTIFENIDRDATYTIGVENDIPGNTLDENIDDIIRIDQKNGEDTEFYFEGFGRWTYSNNLNWLVKDHNHLDNPLELAQRKIAQAIASNSEQNFITAEYDEVETESLISNHVMAQLRISHNEHYDENNEYQRFNIDVDLLENEYDRSIIEAYIEYEDPENEYTDIDMFP